MPKLDISFNLGHRLNLFSLPWQNYQRKKAEEKQQSYAKIVKTRSEFNLFNLMHLFFPQGWNVPSLAQWFNNDSNWVINMLIHKWHCLNWAGK